MGDTSEDEGGLDVPRRTLHLTPGPEVLQLLVQLQRELAASGLGNLNFHLLGVRALHVGLLELIRRHTANRQKK